MARGQRQKLGEKPQFFRLRRGHSEERLEVVELSFDVIVALEPRRPASFRSFVAKPSVNQP
jgi:hypothetical protein